MALIDRIGRNGAIAIFLSTFPCHINAQLPEVRIPDRFPDVKIPDRLPDFRGGDLTGGMPGLNQLPLPAEIRERLANLPKDAQVTMEKLGQDTLATVTKAGSDTVQSLTRANKDFVTTIEKAGKDSTATVVKGYNDTVTTHVKAWNDTTAEYRRNFDDAVEAAQASARYVQRQAQAQVDTLQSADKRIREGKAVDAMWGAAVEPLQGSERNAFHATQESKVINAAAATAAATYGGPGGAAAYAAWSTYRATGDANMAFRAGLIAGASSQLGGSAAKMPAGTAGQIIKKAVVAGAAGGVAVAAAGGDDQAIQEGFIKAGGAVLIQGANTKLQKYSPKAKDAVDTLQCISARDIDCVSKTTWAKDAKGKLLLDKNGKFSEYQKKLDPQQHIGKFSKFVPNTPEGKVADVYRKISKLPKSDVIPLIKNRWVLTTSLDKDPTIPYGVPKVVLTEIGPDAPFVSTVTYGRTGPGKYSCSIGQHKREISTTQSGNACTSIYKRQDGSTQRIWKSEHNSAICLGKAAEFVDDLKRKGISCQPS